MKQHILNYHRIWHLFFNETTNIQHVPHPTDKKQIHLVTEP